MHELSRRRADAACGPARLSRLPSRARGQSRRRSGLHQMSREQRAHDWPHEVHRLSRAASLRQSRGESVHELSPRSARARSREAHLVYDLSRAARGRAARVYVVSSGDDRPSQGRLHGLSPAALARARRDREGRRLRDLSHRRAPRDRALSRVSHAARRQAEARCCHVCELPPGPGEDRTVVGPRRLHELSPRARAEANRDRGVLRELPQGRGNVRTHRSRAVRGLPRHTRAEREADELRHVPHRQAEDRARPRHRRLHDLPSRTRAERCTDAARVHELPRGRAAPWPTCGRAARALQRLPLRARSQATQRSRDLPGVSSRPREPRADRPDVRRLPPVRPLTTGPYRSRRCARASARYPSSTRRRSSNHRRRRHTDGGYPRSPSAPPRARSWPVP